jgi:hypothetical protein
MRFGVLCLLLCACGFDRRLAPNDELTPPDTGGEKTPDAPTTTGPDAYVKVCAAAYQPLPAAQTQSKYRRVQVQTPWLDAKADCESDGGYLVIPETTTEAVAVHAFVDPLDSSPYFWAGILDPEQDAQWMTVTGVPFTIPAWGSGDPDQRVGEIYAIVYSDGKFYDWFDYGEQEYACECAP